MIAPLKQMLGMNFKWYSTYPSSNKFTKDMITFYDQFNSLEDFVEYAEHTLGKDDVDSIRLKSSPTTLFDMYWYFV
jgi:predicted dithiol-disulfide oxidoreductase (DUF899 family)